MVPLLILASGCTSARQGTHLPYHFLLFCVLQVIPMKQQRSSASILSADCKHLDDSYHFITKIIHRGIGVVIANKAFPTALLLGGALVDEPTQPSIQKVSWLFSSSSPDSISLGSTTQSHMKMEPPSSVGRTGQKCAPTPAESPSRTLCRASLCC